ncbi:hypothetical protein EV44_g5820 [Erysiphe necator]|uniref:Uncharacterized protein n=1 Tax=Uncinula necator TaxID=52586 RepID=A0A0B1P2N7_UNCNE|nr:hypothetical protein EV44_g5820 [Erysiphe necator]
MEVSMCPKDTQVKTDHNTSNEVSRPAFAPALSSSRALARFEFEAGKGNEGTKILMVEWIDDERESNWLVSWEGKRTVLPAKDIPGDKLVRIYFLLAPDANIPRIVYISRVGEKSQQMQTNPLPAIFPPELGITTQIRKGVLHTIWAKKRLSALEEEITLEMKNGEGVGLEMALREKKWIEDNFGVISKSTPELQSPMSTSPATPPWDAQSTPILKNISLAKDIPQTNTLNLTDESSLHSLSLDINDVALSSFPLFDSSGFVSKSSQIEQNFQPLQEKTELIKQKISKSGIYHPIDSVADGTISMKQIAEADDGLFALKLSPRSPEMTRSPFSINI